MSTQFRDTHFGHLIRYLSGKRALRYPDEVNPLIWEKRIHPFVRSECSKPQENQNSPHDTAANVSDIQDSTFYSLRELEGHQEIILVEWYGPDDPEVGSFLCRGSID